MNQPIDPRTLEVAWRLLEFSRASVEILEESTTRVAAAQIAGLIALWTQLHTFDEDLPAALAWLALALLVASVLLMAQLATPRRLARFWQGVATRDVLAEGRPIRPDEEAAIVGDLTRTMNAQMLRLRTGLRISIVSAGVALTLVVLAYAIEKTLE